VTLFAKSKPVDLATHRAMSARADRPLGAGELIDINAAGFAEIDRLPRMGTRLAKTIVRIRTERGGFASLAELDSVPGVGPALLAAIGPHLTLGDTGRVRRGRPSGGGRAQSTLPESPRSPLVVGPPKGSQSASPPLRPAAPPIRLNSASELDLVALPGIGPVRAKAILAYRQGNGPFASVWDLENVPGLSRRLVRQLASQVVVP
jgi:competence ComEA-like helix-hairpin-helix protein